MIVYCAKDLMFETRIRATAEALGVPTRGVAHAAALQRRLDGVADGKLNEPVQAVFIDLDLGDAAAAMIRQVKGANAAIPVIAFGSHVATDVLQAARDAGADAVMARGQFVVELPGLLQKHGSVI